jgi:hypothetical protein
MIVGVIVALFAAVFVSAHISVRDGKPTLTYRQPETWTTHATILVSQQGFSVGGSVPSATLRNSSPGGAGVTPQYFTTYALTYAELADSDPVRALMRRAGPVVGTYTATAVTSAANAGNALPFVRIDSIANSPGQAVVTAVNATKALMAYIRGQQDAAHVADDARILLVPMERAAPPTILQKRSMFRPLAAFIVLMLLFCILAFVLENLRPRVRLGEVTPLRESASADDDSATRRTA